MKMACPAAQDPEPTMTESLVSLLSHGVRMQLEQRTLAPPAPTPVPTGPQESPEERRLRIRRVLANALEITSDSSEDEDYDAFLTMFQGGNRQ